MTSKLKTIMADVFNVDEKSITGHTKQNDFQQWDSLKHISLISAFEEEFNITIEPEEISVMTDFKSIENIIISKLAKK